MASTLKVPAVTMANVSSDEKIATAVNVAVESDKRNESTKSDSALFLYAVVMFTDRQAKELAETFGAKAPAISKAGRVVRYYMDEMFPDRDSVFTVADFDKVADHVRAEHGNVFAAYRELFPTVRAEKTLATELARLYKKSGMDAETFGLFATGVAESVDASATGDDENDDDQ